MEYVTQVYLTLKPYFKGTASVIYPIHALGADTCIYSFDA